MNTMIFDGRNRVRYAYARWGCTRGGGKTWHGGIDIEGLDSRVIRMPGYRGKSIAGSVVTARRVTDKSNPTWEWGWYVCVRLDAAQTPDPVNYLYFCHCDKLLVKPGQKVRTGDALAAMGNTGNAALANPPYAHVHFEVRKTATSQGLDPTAYCGFANAVGTYGTAPASPAPAPEPVPEPATAPAAGGMQLLLIGPLDADGAAACDALAARQALAGMGRYATLPAPGGAVCKAVGAVSSGDAMQYYRLAQQRGWTDAGRYYARYV